MKKEVISYCFVDAQHFKQNSPMFLQDITLVRAKMPSLVRSGDAGIRSQQGARAIARDMLGQVSANPDPPLLPFDDTWIQEIKVRVSFFFLLFWLLLRGTRERTKKKERRRKRKKLV
jgi:hypothetical protein